MFNVIEEFTHAKAHEFPDCVAELTIIDMDTGKEFARQAVEVNTIEGWADVYVEPHDPAANMYEIERVKGNFRLVLVK